MSRPTAQEINRLFGPYRPDWNTNVRHHAILRKALEFYTLDELILIFGHALNRLRVKMGTNYTSSQLGIIISNYAAGHNHK